MTAYCISLCFGPEISSLKVCNDDCTCGPCVLYANFTPENMLPDSFNVYFSILQMITKSKECNDIHELCISQAEFERREKKKESIYGGAILNRRVRWSVCGQKLVSSLIS